MKSLFRSKLLLFFGISVLYFFIRLPGLTQLPVFADEAIYIRWSQLIIDDWQQYLFFPLNDGKTPLFVWGTIPFLLTFADPLWAGRFFSVWIGLLQLWVVYALVKKSGGKQMAVGISLFLALTAPFWYFYQRMALMDALLTFFLSLTVLGLMQMISPNFQKKAFTHKFFTIAFIGTAFGGALWSKVPGIFLAPLFPFFAFWEKKRSPFIQKSFWIAGAGIIGLGMFFTLKLHPAFSQLFGRGSDFTFSISEVLAGEWRTSLNNIPRVFVWLAYYVSTPLLLLSITAPLTIRKNKYVILLFLMAVIFAAPFLLLGRVITPRYFLPLALPLTILSSLMIEHFWQTGQKYTRSLVVLVLAVVVVFNSRFIFWSIFNSDQLALPPVDRVQYLEEWSSGHGMKETVEIIRQYSQQGRVFVATEGFFGTLPDALNMYFHRQDVRNIKIEGIGAPVSKLPANFFSESRQANTTLLVVNSHRMHINDTRFVKIATFPRSNNAPSLDVYQFIETREVAVQPVE